jgi:uncharacterized protein (DUF2249 family)
VRFWFSRGSGRLAGCKAFLEHGVELKLVPDHDPDAIRS